MELSSDGTVRVFTDMFSRWGVRRSTAPDTAAVAPDVDPVFPTKAFSKFLSCLESSEAPSLVDLGPVVGSNINFLGERLGCKIFVEDVVSDLERHARQDTLGAFPEFLKNRFTQTDQSVDGVLCWDLFDYMDRQSARMLARELVRMLRTNGAVLGLFATAPNEDMRYTKYVIIDDFNLQHKSYAGSRGRRDVLLNRDIIKMFEGLLVSDSFLLQTNTREILFRKPSYLGAHRTPL